MTMDSNQHNDPNETPAPPKLVAALRRSQAGRVFVPPTVDEAILRAARNHLAPARRTKQSLFGVWLRWPAVAASFALLVVVAYRLVRPESTSNPRTSYAQADLNHDGRVDILDALQLARQLESGGQPSPASDINGDGSVDRRDAAVIATMAVKLEKGRRS
jgi:Dockerin type I domain